MSNVLTVHLSTQPVSSELRHTSLDMTCAKHFFVFMALCVVLLTLCAFYRLYTFIHLSKHAQTLTLCTSRSTDLNIPTWYTTVGFNETLMYCLVKPVSETRAHVVHLNGNIFLKIVHDKVH